MGSGGGGAVREDRMERARGGGAELLVKLARVKWGEV